MKTRTELGRLARGTLLLILGLLVGTPAVMAQGNWGVRTLPGNPVLTDVSFAQPTTGLICGGDGLLLRTTDAGNTWQSVAPSDTSWLHALQHVTPQLVYCAGDNGVLLRSEDGGQSWQQVSVPTNRHLLTLAFPSRDTGYVAGEQGVVLRTYDGGQHWRPVSFPELDNDVLALHFRDAHTGWATGRPASCCGGNALVMKTHDGGAHWTTYKTQIITPLKDLVQFGDSLLYWLGESGRLLRTPDSGQTFTRQPTGLGEVNSLAFRDPAHGYAATTNGQLAYTADSGHSWSPAIVNANRPIEAVTWVDSSHAYAIGLFGEWYWRRNAVSRPAAKEASPALQLRFRPQPARPQDLRYQLQAPDPGHAIWTLYDTQGRRVARRTLRAGAGSLGLQGLTGGLYFWRLRGPSGRHSQGRLLLQ
jgi:photosystem II stability/assembly factor-like uncharacterized protein